MKYPLILLWEYPLIWLGVLVVLLGLRYLIPHFSMSTQWEKKYTTELISVGRDEPPPSAKPVTAVAEIPALFGNTPSLSADVLKFNGPVVTHAWACKPFQTDSVCLRLIWQGEPLTLAVTDQAHKYRNPQKLTSKGKLQASRSTIVRHGWGGVILVRGAASWTLVGPFTPDELTAAWSFSQEFETRD